MDDYAGEACSVVYLCAGADDEVYELYHKRSPPDAPPKSGEDGGSALDRVYHNVRILLDEDQGGFSEGRQRWHCALVEYC